MLMYLLRGDKVIVLFRFFRFLRLTNRLSSFFLARSSVQDRDYRSIEIRTLTNMLLSKYAFNWNFLHTAVIIWVSAIILIVLFYFQKYGTNKVAFLFSPIMALWLLTTPMVGIYNIIQHYPSVFKAFSPHFIYRFFQKNGKEGWQMLGGIVLCITGMVYQAGFSLNFIAVNYL